MDFINNICNSDDSTSKVIEEIIYNQNSKLNLKKMTIMFVISLCDRAKLAGVDEKEYISLVASIQNIEDQGLWKNFSSDNVYCNKKFCELEYKLFKQLVEYLTLREKILYEEKINNTLKRKYDYIS
tara:strand:- start:3317 stop:3694 length:378 start_codon:yes stop_codon:yes gene_type:complete